MRSRNSDGYTLLELLVVMAILSTLAAVAIPVASRSVESAMLNSDVRETVVELRRLESEAVARQTTISVSQGKEGTLSFSTGESWTVPSGSVIALTSPRVSFYPDGTSGGGALEVSRGGDNITIAVAWLSGDVEVLP